ncbi:Flagellar biosynthesis protein FlhA [gamma proteobacterium IMCC1989]|nr:Flagellar biosynthesis protein FlhA [gamma proteobacterium IMCC1989]
MEALYKKLGNQSDLVLVLVVVGILFILFTPIPSPLLDFLLIANISCALLILLMTFYVDKPLQFSTFPSLLLIATLFRLSLNIASTRLILADADAGDVIATVGSYVVGGNYIIGLIVFIVLIVVQYVVVTNGAQRVAEVAARFTLDAMPGKQMSIDADLNMGLITAEEAQTRRNQIEKEANFYGAMDGASKFVKGDAIAGIIIVLINIIGGLTIGVAQLGMNWGDALQTFTLLTVGDGIVTQIPALVISTGTGIIVTRAASDSFLSKEIAKQITTYPKILGLLFFGLFLALFLPGIPIMPVLFLLLIIGFILFAVLHKKRKQSEEEVTETTEENSSADDDVYKALTVESIELKIGQNLVPLFNGDETIVMDKVSSFRKQYAMDIGFVMPKLRINDDKKLPPNTYEFWVYGAQVGTGELYVDRQLAINPGSASGEAIEGIETVDPTYGFPSIWILKDQITEAKQIGYTVVDSVNVLITHLAEMVKRQASNLLTRSEVEKLLENLKPEHAGLIDELIPAQQSLGDLQKVLQALLDERVSIRNLQSIIEVLADESKQTRDVDYLISAVRKKLGAVICQRLLAPDNSLRVLVLDPNIEQTLASGMRKDGDNKVSLIIDPALTEKLITTTAAHAEDMISTNYQAVLLCAPELRPHLRKFTARLLPNLSILSMNEIPTNIDVKSYAMIKL